MAAGGLGATLQHEWNLRPAAKRDRHRIRRGAGAVNERRLHPRRGRPGASTSCTITGSAPVSMTMREQLRGWCERHGLLLSVALACLTRFPALSRTPLSVDETWTWYV